MFVIDDTKKRPFRVVVVGAGIAGLTLSNALQRANIEHVVLEKHKQVVYPSGASIGIWPNGSRLLKQLGCLELVDKACSVMKVSYTRNADGKAIITSELFDEITKRSVCCIS
jgi:2-polyprenyl-6-methoxyphenol hydroxylase-like FAD-dependent oxidoreductase